MKITKKVLAVLCAAMLAFSLMACSNDNKNESSTPDTDQPSSSDVGTPSDDDTDTPETNDTSSDDTVSDDTAE